MNSVRRCLTYTLKGKSIYNVRSLFICTTIGSYVKCTVGIICLEKSFKYRNYSSFQCSKLIKTGDCELKRGLKTSKPTNMANISNHSDCNVLKLSDYDCVGFDLDNTLCEYNIAPVVQMEYEVLSKFVVEEKGYDPEYLLKPITDKDIDFFHKGLLVDFTKGNIIQISDCGVIYRASHGTKMLTDAEIVKQYGSEKKWEVTNEFVNNMLVSWNGPLSQRMRALLDYFDMPASLVFARIIDSLDAKLGKAADMYKVWPDVLDGLVNMYKREHFAINKGGYFPRLKAQPEKFINKCNPQVVQWLKEIKKSKKVFLITGSNVDYASFTAKYSLGDDWRSLFDIIVCYTRKPGFFTGGRPFIGINGILETDPIVGHELKYGNIYSQGNWQDLYQLFKTTLNKNEPKCVYFGDNLIQDIYTPSEYTKCDVVAIVEEMNAEGMANVNDCKMHPSCSVLVSKTWGSYFGDEKCGIDSIWSGIIRKYSKCCVPSLSFLAQKPLNFEIKTFCSDEKQHNLNGYYPSLPISLSRQEIIM